MADTTPDIPAPDDPTGFQPAPFQIVSEPQQLKAFADPLRNRIMHLLADREATNQQLAATLGESQAKVLHHVRVLVETGLIVLVAERIKGGNVEKYYRATARIYGIRATPDDESSITAPVFEGLLQEIVASETRWPGQPQSWELRRARLSPQRVAEFTTRINALIGEYWGNGDEPAPDEPGAPLMAFASVTFRHPIDDTPDAPDASDAPDAPDLGSAEE
ncbi:MAG: winged helix-turn-helix domain-containing protein [Thermomicrobiales bacterium]